MLAILVTALLIHWATHRDGNGSPWEQMLVVLSPFLAAVSATDVLRDTRFLDADLPGPLYYVGFACTMAVAILAHIVLRWEQAMYVEDR
jgi:hypothetical protein